MNGITNAAPQIVNLMEKGGITPDQTEKIAQDLENDEVFTNIIGDICVGIITTEMERVEREENGTGDSGTN